jgi:hypothetical protein
MYFLSVKKWVFSFCPDPDSWSDLCYGFNVQTQQVAKAYGALCTPDFYLFKKVGKGPFELVYHGRFDDSRPRSNTPITGRDIREALDATLSGQPVSGSQKPRLAPCNCTSVQQL